MIEATGLSAGYETDAGSHTVIEGLSFVIPRREPVAVIGPSGCGKTTLLYLLAGLKTPWRGQVRIDGRPIDGPRLKTAVILQHYGLFPWKTVWENAALGLKIRKVFDAGARERLRRLLAELDLAGLERQFPSQLSGGQQQRVAVARALALEPDVLIMDEPFSSLDALTRESLQNLMLRLGAERDLTSVLVTHSIPEAALLGRRIMIMPPTSRQPVELLDNPAAGSPEYRTTDEFHHLCNRLREHLGRWNHA